MKRHWLAAVLAAVLVAACAAGCSASGESSQTEPETKPKATVSSTVATVQDTTAASTQAATTAPKKKTTTNKKKKTTAATAPKATVSPTAPSNIPPNSISGANINPALNSIANRVQGDINSSQVTSISLSESSVELSVGDAITIDVSYNPEGAMYKLCSASVSNAGVEIVSKTNSKIKLKGISAGTTVLTVTSQNGHKATCNITVKRNETITDDTKLNHKDLCTAENVNRWTAELTAHCVSMGMSHDSGLKGADIAIDTADNAGTKKSYNDVKTEYISSVNSQLDALIEGDAKDYEFNCYSESKGGGEYLINVVIIKSAE